MDRLPCVLQNIIRDFLKPSKWAEAVGDALRETSYCYMTIPIEYISIVLPNGDVRFASQQHHHKYHETIVEKEVRMMFANRHLLCMSLCSCGGIIWPLKVQREMPFFVRGLQVNVH